ncbi:MAG: hypothetical protein M1823_001890 [Watsoniomyces obsoletus]|nr:MAG: hypothetical protein M1823_001890 [Watsoniomyces obsoletus]
MGMNSSPFLMDFSDIRSHLADEISFSDPRSYTSWDLDELSTSSPTTLDLESSWHPLDPMSPVVISGTQIPRATDFFKDTDLMSRYLQDQGQGRHGYHVAGAPASGGGPGGPRRGSTMDSSSYTVSPTYALPPHFPAGGFGPVGPLTSPTTTSGADDHSGTGPEMGSSFNGAWSDRASDGPSSSSYLGGGRPSEATTTTLSYQTTSDMDHGLYYGRPQQGFLPSQTLGAAGVGVGGGGNGGASGRSLSTVSRDPSVFINPRQVQQDLSPVDNPQRPEETATTGIFPLHHYPHLISGQPESMNYGPIGHMEVGRRATEASIGSVEMDQHPSPAHSGSNSNSHPRSPSVRSTTRELTGPTRPGRVTKNKAPRHCTEHPQLSFKTASDWKRHLQTSHKQPFRCILANYGCDQMFGSKNEWKRHINCLHLRLTVWRCDIDSCQASSQQQSQSQHQQQGQDQQRRNSTAKPNKKSSQTQSHRSPDFNRKDLFTQHLQRLHAPAATKSGPNGVNSNANNKSSATNAAATAKWRSEIAQIQERCLVQNRAPPSFGCCGFCRQEFHGDTSWDDCLEHVGKHYEDLNVLPRSWRDDPRLREWMLEHGLLRRDGNGNWELTVEGKRRRSSQQGRASMQVQQQQQQQQGGRRSSQRTQARMKQRYHDQDDDVDMEEEEEEEMEQEEHQAEESDLDAEAEDDDDDQGQGHHHHRERMVYG